MRRYTLTTVRSEFETAWHVIDRNAPETEQLATVRSFCSRNRGETYMTACCYLDRMNRKANVSPLLESRSTLEAAERAWSHGKGGE